MKVTSNPKIKMTILCGISGSGKSTYAHSKWLENPLDTIIVNRDKIRESLFGFTEDNVEYYYHHKDFWKLEQGIVSLQEEKMVELAIRQNLNVILDATHLKYSYINKWDKFSDNFNIEVKYFDIPLEKALERNSQRKRKVLESIIRNQYERYKKLKNDL